LPRIAIAVYNFRLLPPDKFSAYLCMCFSIFNFLITERISLSCIESGKPFSYA
jgi:hypothetical protein